jgi:hypothetical protein
MEPYSQLAGVASLKPNQMKVFLCAARFRVLVAGRRFGKTHLALFEIMRMAYRPNRLIWYIGPNDRQSKRIVWDRLKTITRLHWAKRPNETQMRIDLKSGSTIVVNGAFNPEYASMKPEAWAEVLRPALSDRQGHALFIGTPKGRNHLYERFEYALNDPNWAAFQFTTAQGGLVEDEELVQAARELDPVSYQQEFGGEFVSANRNRVYYTFDRDLHVRPQTFQPLYPVIWSIDFNVNPMCMLLMQRVGDVVYVFDEIVLPNANTEAACQAFLDKAEPLYQMVPGYQRPMNVEVYGDASGNQKRTSAAETDWTIIRQFFRRWKGTYQESFHILSANPPVRDRINCVNSRLRNTFEENRLFIDPRCRELVKDLEQVAWATDSTGAVTSDLDKSDRARTHASDALGYYIAQVFPLKPLIGHQSSGRIL